MGTKPSVEKCDSRGITQSPQKKRKSYLDSTHSHCSANKSNITKSDEASIYHYQKRHSSVGERKNKGNTHSIGKNVKTENLNGGNHMKISTSASEAYENGHKGKNEEKDNSDQKKMKVVFEWDEGGEEVEFTADFLKNWAILVKMHKNKEKGNFFYETMLPPGKYQFKFYVDGRHMCSNRYKKVKNGGRVANNEIELIPKKDDKKENHFISPKQQELLKTIIENDKKKKLKKLEENKIKIMHKVYGIYYPTKSQMGTYTPEIPLYYKETFNIDNLTNQGFIGSPSYLLPREEGLLSENNSFKEVPRSPHVTLGHLSLRDFGKENNTQIQQQKRSCIELSVTENRKHKGLTIVYYLPVNKEERQ